MKKKLIPDYLDKLQIYKAGKPIEEVAKEKGLTKISKLASNENPLGPSPYAMKNMTTALWDIHRYPDMHGTDLKKKLCELYDLKAENIILGNGSEGIIAYIARAFIQPGDEVLTAEKTFIGFHILATGAGGKIVTCPRTKDMRYDVKALAKAVSDDTKVLYIANPDNPTGTYITEKEFDYLMEFVPEHTIVILDEAYFEFAQSTWDYPDSMKYRYNNVITLRTFSKAYGLSGIRVGYGFGSEELISALHKVKLPFEPNLIAQKGAIGALSDFPHLKRTIQHNSKRYDETIKFLESKNFTLIQSITNFICFHTGSAKASEYLFNELLNRGVIIRSLGSNHMPDWVRVSIGTKNEMNHFFEAMEEILLEYDKKFRPPS